MYMGEWNSRLSGHAFGNLIFYLLGGLRRVPKEYSGTYHTTIKATCERVTPEQRLRRRVLRLTLLSLRCAKCFSVAAGHTQTRTH